MKHKKVASFVLVGLVSVWIPVARGDARTQEQPKVQLPQPGVPQAMTMEGKFVRAAYNNEGYAILGYKLANDSIGEEWMLLEFGTTVRDGVPNYVLTRDALSLELPNGKTIPLASISEQRAGNTIGLQNRAKVARDSINYFPPSASRPCRIGFFAELNSSLTPFNQVELNSQLGCLGRLYFHVPGGIAYGQHWLNVKFEKSIVRVPFRILTKDEEKFLSRNYKDISKQVEEAFTKKK